MTAERWQQVKGLLHGALELPPSERGAFLAGACGGDDSLRGEVEALLLSYDSPATELGSDALAEADADALVGRTAGPYEILSRLGAGGMGEVYLARDDRLGRKVALKILPAGFTRDAERVRRFHQEASAASRLNHPNILTIYEVGQLDATTHYIATEYIDGVTVRELIWQKKIGIGEVLDIALQVASALAAAHAAGIVHRDVKPENVMVRRDGYVKVLDFGIAKLTEKPGPSQSFAPAPTEPGTVMGTVTYMSPEQTRGFDVDARTDIWSLGVVLYEMVSGQPPFVGETRADVIVSILERDPAPLAHSEGVPVALEPVIRRALARDKRARHASIEDLARDLRVIKSDSEFAARARGASGGAVATSRGLDETTLVEPARHANNLSTTLPALVGRAAETAAIATLLRRDDVRIVTLTGAGGTGKTRVVQQAARDLLIDFDDGVFFVPLAPINNHNLVASAIAQTLGVQETSARTFAEGLKNYLRDKHVLLVLDNFEHVIGAAPLIAELLAACLPLKILVTSRAALHITGEHEFRVSPLALPDASHTADELMQSAAALLFVQRVLAVKPDFTVTDANARTIAAICIRLDGLPLAIELAAARTKLLSVEEMLARMDNRLNLLKGGARDLPERQQTMRATIAWSYELLGPDAKTLCHRLSVFFGGAALSAVEAVCGDASGVEINVLDALESVVDESLVLKKEMADGTYRFLMLETIREYALERLDASGESDALRRKHATFFLAIAEDADAHLTSVDREPWLQRLDADYNNIRAALRWAADNGETDIGLRFVGALRWYWYYRAHIGEGYHWALRLLSLPNASTPNAARANALFSAGSLAFYYSDAAAARPLLEESVALWRALGDKRRLAYSLTFSGLPILLSQDDFDAARAAAEEAVAVFRELDDPWGLALAMNYGGVIAWTDSDLEKEATTLFEDSAALFRKLGDGWGISGAALYLGAILQEHGDLAAARAKYEECVALMRESKDMWRLASTLEILAELVRADGEDDYVAALTEESARLQERLGKSLNLRKAWGRMKRKK